MCKRYKVRTRCVTVCAVMILRGVTVMCLLVIDGRYRGGRVLILIQKKKNVLKQFVCYIPTSVE